MFIHSHTDCDGYRYCSAGETIVFENCVFDSDFCGTHFALCISDVVIKSCTFTGFNTFGSVNNKWIDTRVDNQTIIATNCVMRSIIPT